MGSDRNVCGEDCGDNGGSAGGEDGSDSGGGDVDYENAQVKLEDWAGFPLTTLSIWNKYKDVRSLIIARV